MADVAALTSIAKAALQVFSSLAKDEALLLWNSEEELLRLMGTFEVICSILRDADQMQPKPEAVQNCLSRLRGSMYDIEDLIDDLAYVVLRKRTTGKVRLLFSKSNQLYVFFKTTHEVKSLRKCLDHLTHDLNMCGLILRPQPPHAPQHVMRVDRKKTQSLVHEEDVIGRDQERAQIIDMLLSEDKGLSVVAIIGSGGWGKTTLAQYVYNNEGVKHSFDERLWACVNDLSNTEQVLIEIIASKEGRKHDRGLELLKDDFRRITGGKKFLLVLDDVWDVDFNDWLDLEPILRSGKSGSKVLVTTRSRTVADCLNAPMPYRVHLEVLSEKSAWSLFVKKANCEVEVSEHPELEQLGKKILQRCGNVPLAIIMVGSLLAHREKEERIWSNFLYKDLETALSNDRDIKKVLMFSYNDLHPNLKLCFAYCALFPKDHVFDKDELVHLWTAQGFVKTSANNGQSLEEEGEAYFFYLVERCFFQEVKQHERWHRYGLETSCSVGEYRHTAKMHDLLHDVAISVAETEIGFLDKGSINKRHSLRHICINDDSFDRVDGSFDYWTMVSDSKATLRTLLFHCSSLKKISNHSLDTLLPHLRKLRSLCLPNSGIDHISDSVGELTHLRYLDLSENRNLKQLPKSICKLHHLMFLDLRDCRLLDRLPKKIGKLVNLRQLYLEGCHELDPVPSGLKDLTSLVRLDRVIVDRHNGGLGYLNRLDNLCGSLDIELPREGWPDAIEDAKKANMLQKHKVNGMVIKWTGNDASATGAHLFGKEEARAVMEAFQPVESLEYLKISKYEGEMLWGWVWMLKNMKELYLSGCDYVEYLVNGITSTVCFPSLKVVEIVKMKNLRGWWRQEVVEEAQRLCFSLLSSVSIRDCPELKGQMPVMQGIESLNLERVDVKLVEELLLHVNPSSSFPSSFQLREITGLICLQEGWIQHLTALQEFAIEHCTDLRWVSGRGLAHLTALKSLQIYYSGEVGDEDEDEDEKMGNGGGMPWKALQGLEHLDVGVGNKQLLVGLQYLTRLQSLRVDKWANIEEEDGVELQFKGLHNLGVIDIVFDGKTVVHLPTDGIQDLHSLTRLRLQNCKGLYWSWKTLLSMKLETLYLNCVDRVMDVDEDGMRTAVQHQSLLNSLFICGGAAEKCVDDIP